MNLSSSGLERNLEKLQISEKRQERRGQTKVSYEFVDTTGRIERDFGIVTITGAGRVSNVRRGRKVES